MKYQPSMVSDQEKRMSEVDTYFIDAYNAYLYSHYDFDKLANSFADQIKQRHCQKILDCTAGIGGDLSLKLIYKGFDLVCTEQSKTMVERFRDAAERFRLPVKCQRLDWDSLDRTESSYDYVICQSNSLVYGLSWEAKPVVNEADIRRYLMNFASVLRPGGYLHIDAPWEPSFEWRQTKVSESLVSKNELPGIGKLQKIIAAEYIEERQKSRHWECTIAAYPKNSQSMHTYTLRRNSIRLTVQDFPRLLKDCGFDNIQILQLPGSRSIHGTLIAQKGNFDTPSFQHGRKQDPPKADATLNAQKYYAEAMLAGTSASSTTESHSRTSFTKASDNPDQTRDTEKPLRITVALGGATEQHESSTKTAHDTVKILKKLGHSVALANVADVGSMLPLVESSDVVVNAIHGLFGEDGALTALCERLDTPVTGPTSSVHIITWDKAMFKSWANLNGVKTPTETFRAMLEEPANSQLLIKPRKGGDSQGVELLYSDRTSLMTEAYDRLFERFTPGRHMSVCVLRNAEEADFVNLPLVEIISTKSIHTKEQKKGKDTSASYKIIWNSNNAREECIKTESQAIYNSLGAGGLLQFDWIIPEDGTEPLLLECNSNPKLHRYSVSSLIASAVGMTHEELLEKLVFDAIARNKS